ncbi:MAG: hypothetical protein ACRCST_01375 [Turicibacter sp.]
MRYIEILERLEEGRYSVKQAEKEILKMADRQIKRKAKRFSLNIEADGCKIKLSGLYIGAINGLLSLSQPFLVFVPRKNKGEGDEKEFDSFGREDIYQIVAVSKVILKDFKKYPPMTLISVRTKDEKILIETK